MVDFENKLSYGVYDLKRIVELLRAPGGCPWDYEQTHESIRRNLLEEAYEAAEAIDECSAEHLCEELGDVLMQIVFHSDIEEKAGRFTLDDVADMACKKLIRRHPHVFGDTQVKDSDGVIANWDAIKREEKRQDMTAGEMQSVARSLPALWRAEKIQKKASKAGFDWPTWLGAMEALRDELRELEEAASSGGDVEGELGDLIFSAVNVARFFEIDAEQALGLSCDKFISRFERLENSAIEMGRRLREMTLDEMEMLYQQVKLEE